jgi:hypothetical protein
VSEKPSYLGLLNAISVGESNAHCYLSAWAETTPDDGVRAVLRTVAAREGEHGMSFAKRINELGYHVRTKEDPNTAKVMDLVTSDCSDLEKMEKLHFDRYDTGKTPDIFDSMFADQTIDIRTGELLGRYIAEERDSGRLLRSCYEQVKAGSTSSVASLEQKVDDLCRVVDELRQVVGADERRGRTNGRTKVTR